VSRPGVAELLAALNGALAGRRWYVFGAQAAVTYGRPRLTADVDITVEPVDDLREMLAALGRADLSLRLPGFDAMLDQARVLPLVHEPSGLPVDLVLAGPGLEEEFLARARTIDMGGVSVPMISPEDLVATKLLAGRPKDLEDVAGVLAEQEHLDVERIRSVLAALEGALDQTDLLPAFEKLLAAARPAKPAPSRRRRPRR
jgi:hypothetical protein